MNKPHCVILSSSNTKTHLVPFYHWDTDTRQVEPTTTHQSHRRNIDLVGQTISMDQRKSRSYRNHARKNHIRIYRRLKYLS